MKQKIKQIIASCGGYLFLGALKWFNAGLRAVSGQMHRFQQFVEWRLLPNPEWFDHSIDLTRGWRSSRNPLWVERGIFNLLAIAQNAKVLELCCGDGFNAYHFYSIRAEHIVAVDFDPKAIAHARRYNQAPNVDFLMADIRQDIPEGCFDSVIIDAALEHFTPEEIDHLLVELKKRIKSEGILSGYTIVERPDHTKSLHQHEYEFSSKGDLLRFLKPHFGNVKVFETVYPTRHNLYFFASDGVLPFDDRWNSMTTGNRDAIFLGK